MQEQTQITPIATIESTPETTEVYCDKCLEPMLPNGQADDIGTVRYQCKNGHQTTTPRTKKQRDQSAELRARLAEECKPENIKKTVEEARKRHSSLVDELLKIPEDGKRENKSQADIIVELCEEHNIEFFHDQYGAEYARITVTNDTNDTNSTIGSSSSDSLEHTENVPLNGKHFKHYLTHLFRETQGKMPQTEAVNSALNELNYKATNGKQYTLFNRVAPDPEGKGFWLDLADEQHRAIHITPEAWTVENEVPILFKRYKHMQPIPLPTKDGNPSKLLNYINIGNEEKLLALTQACSYLIPDIAHAGFMLYGPKGTWKSCGQHYVKSIFDPSSASKFTLPKKSDDLIMQLEKHWIIIYDNLEDIDDWLSNVFCSAITGASQETRELYTNDDSIIRTFKRCIMLNGVNLPVSKSDLLDRSVLYQTVPQPNQRRTEAELNQSFEAERQEILGGFLDILVKALQLKQTKPMKPSKLFRLADYTEWGCYISQALGYSANDFIKAYERNVNLQNEETVNSSPVATAFISYCINLEPEPTKTQPKIVSPSGLLSEVEAEATELRISVKQAKWPKSANSFTRRLKEDKDAINALGWDYESIHDGISRTIHIWKTHHTTIATTNQLDLYQPTPTTNSLVNVVNTVDIVSTLPSRDPDKQPNQKEQVVYHYRRLNPKTESRICDKCKGKQAEYKAEQLYLCPDCFNDAKTCIEKEGERFSEILSPLSNNLEDSATQA